MKWSTSRPTGVSGWLRWVRVVRGAILRGSTITKLGKSTAAGCDRGPACNESATLGDRPFFGGPVADAPRHVQLLHQVAAQKKLVIAGFKVTRECLACVLACVLRIKHMNPLLPTLLPPTYPSLAGPQLAALLTRFAKSRAESEAAVEVGGSQLISSQPGPTPMARARQSQKRRGVEEASLSTHS